MNEVQVFLYIGESYHHLKGLEFVSGRMLCDVIVLNKLNYVKDSF
jgi:hypothetical protein